MKRVVWIVSEGSPGHLSQSEGLVTALARQIDLESTVIQTRPRLKGFVRQLVRLWMGNRALSDRFINLRLHCDFPASKPDLIVTSGGKAVFAARSLSVKFGVPLVFLGERKPYPSEWFHTVFTPSPFENGVNDVPIEMIPTGITPETVAAAASDWSERPEGALWAMIIGGPSASHDYSDSDWQSLGEKMNSLAASHGIRWLISTSRRTGAAAEAILRKTLEPKYLARAVWWSEKPEKLMAAFLGSAEWVFVTQDSVTMVTEAVASGRPVVVLFPVRTRLDPTGFLRGYFERLEKAARIARIRIEVLGYFHPSAAGLQPRSRPINSELAASLLNRLNWPAK